MTHLPMIINHAKAAIRAFFLLFLLFGVPQSVFAKSSPTLSIGDNAPAFSLKNQYNDTISLSDYQGKWVVLYFYPKDDTPGCTTEACDFRDQINRIIGEQADVLGVSTDNTKSHQQFSQKFKLPFFLLSDESTQVAEQYGSLLNLMFIKFAKRHTFIVNPEGKIAKIYRSVDPKTHVRDVLADLKVLQKNAR